MQVHIELNEEDYVAFVQYYYKKTPAGLRAQGKLNLAGLFIFALFAVYAYFDERLTAQGIGYFLVYLAVSGIVLFLAYRLFLWYLRPTFARCAVRFGLRKRMITPTTLAFDDEAITVKTRYGTGRLPWVNVAGAAQTDTHLFILLRGAGINAFILPKRCLQAEPGADAVFTHIADHLEGG